VLGDESGMLEEIKALRALKLEADKETRARKAIDLQLTAKQKIAKDAEKEWKELETRLPLIDKVDIHNRMVTRMNRLVADHKRAMESQKELEETAGKLSSVATVKFVDKLVLMAGKCDAASAKYAQLATNAPLKAAIDKANLSANPKVPLGPSPELATAIADIKKWQSEVESQAIPLREQHGVFFVEVLLNNKPFRMGVDTGASSVTLPAEVAAQLDIKITERDPTIQLKLANGAVITGREISLAKVRVGRFTVDNVRCVVLEPGLPDPPLLLGASFLNHFIVKIDPSKSELHLTELK
jgi:clan AA aspartic protease (TIGR02281 family)